MAKVVSGYTMNNASSISTRASAIGTRTVDSGADTVSTTDIMMSQIGNQTGNTSRSLYELHHWNELHSTDKKINEWSWFGPYSHSVDANNKAIIHTIKNPAKAGDFACYDHNATAPFFEEEDGNITEYSYWEGESGASTVGLAFRPHLGQMNMHAFTSSTEVKVIAYKHGTDTEVDNGTVDYAASDSNWINTGRDVEGPVILESIDIVEGTNTYDIKCYHLDYAGGESIRIGDTLEHSIEVTEKTPTITWEVDDDNPDGYVMWLNNSYNANDEVKYYFRSDDNEFTFDYDKMTLQNFDGDPIQTSGVSLTARWTSADGNTVKTKVVFDNLTTDSNGEYNWTSTQTCTTYDFDLDDKNEVIMHFEPTGP